MTENAESAEKKEMTPPPQKKKEMHIFLQLLK